MQIKETVGKILDILERKDQDWEGIVRKLAREYPEILIDVYEKLTPLKFPNLKTMIEMHGKIPAIKYVREKAGWSLKESKEFVEEYIYVNNLKVYKPYETRS